MGPIITVCIYCGSSQITDDVKQDGVCKCFGAYWLYPYDIKKCYACGSDWSHNDNWIYNGRKNPNLMLCLGCYQRIINRPSVVKKRLYNDRYYTKRGIGPSDRLFNFLGQVIRLKHPPRIGVCNGCRAVKPFDTKMTALHHESYNPKDPLADTIELCPRCHGYADHERRRRNRYMAAL